MTTASAPPDTDTGVRLQIDGERATVTLDRPDKLNAQTPQLWAELARIGRDLPATVRVVVLRGAGRSFSAGLDRGLFTDTSPEGIAGLGFQTPAEIDARIAVFQEAFTWWRRPDIISVAAVQGHAIGGGFQLALACDLRVLADDAQLTMAEPTLGIVPDLGGTGWLVDLVGYPRALEICATGRRVGAAEALGLRLAELVVPRADLDSAVDDLVAAILATPRDAVIETKALLAAAARRTPTERLAAEREAQVRRLRALAGTDD